MDKNTLLVCVYRDTTGLYTEQEILSSNLTDMEFPRNIVEAFFVEKIAPNFPDVDADGEIIIGFDEWLDMYDADDTENLYQFAKEHGFSGKRKD